jgi:hypothetical protein
VWLTGELGSGKTTFVQALSQAAAAGEAHSPTFALVHEYPSPSGLLVHVDCYRLRHADEALDLDFAGVQQVNKHRVTIQEFAFPRRPNNDATATVSQSGHIAVESVRQIEDGQNFVLRETVVAGKNTADRHLRLRLAAKLVLVVGHGEKTKMLCVGLAEVLNGVHFFGATGKQNATTANRNDKHRQLPPI